MHISPDRVARLAVRITQEVHRLHGLLGDELDPLHGLLALAAKLYNDEAGGQVIAYGGTDKPPPAAE